MSALTNEMSLASSGQKLTKPRITGCVKTKAVSFEAAFVFTHPE